MSIGPIHGTHEERRAATSSLTMDHNRRLQARAAAVSLLSVLAVATIFVLRPASARTGMVPAATPVRLIQPFERATPTEAASDKFAALGRIAADRAIDVEEDGQTLVMFGREDLVAGASADFKPTGCSPLPGSANVFDEIVKRARTTSIVVVGESHVRTEHRGFVEEVARRLRPLGYDTLAIEALRNDPPDTPSRYRASFIVHPGLPYLEDGDGYYVSEAGFGRLGRAAKGLGYRLLAYEYNDPQLSAEMTREQRIAVREEGQAAKLADFIRKHPRAKLLIYVGYSHAAEVPRADGSRWMAARLKAKTGVDPLTISQTVCRGGGEAMRLSTLPVEQPAQTFDLVVDHPSVRFRKSRPGWRVRAGDEPVDVPRDLYPATGWRVVEARPVGEDVASVAMDRVAIRHGEDVALMLPPGTYRLRVIDVPMKERRQADAAR